MRAVAFIRSILVALFGLLCVFLSPILALMGMADFEAQATPELIAREHLWKDTAFAVGLLGCIAFVGAAEYCLWIACFEE